MLEGAKIEMKAQKELIKDLQQSLILKNERIAKLQAGLSYTYLFAEYPYVVYSDDMIYFAYISKSTDTIEGILRNISLSLNPDDISEYSEATAMEITGYFNKENPNKHFKAIPTREFETLLLENEKEDVKMIENIISQLETAIS